MIDSASHKQALDAPASLTPITDAARITALDAVRGFALAGVAILNVYQVAGIVSTPAQRSALATANIDHLVAMFHQWALEGRAQFLFGTLFGIGFAIFAQRTRRAGRFTASALVRRIAVLFLVGMVNTLFVFFGDIIHSYALLAILTPIVFLLPSGVLLALGISLVLLSSVIVDGVAAHLLGMDVAALEAGSKPAVQAAMRAIVLSTHYLDWPRRAMAFVEVHDLSLRGAQGHVYFAGQFMIGFWLVKTGLLRKAVEQPAMLRRTFSIALPLGLGLSAIAMANLPALAGVGFLVSRSAALLTGLGYASLMAWLTWRRSVVARLLAAYGRMALTNYLVIGALLMILLSHVGFGMVDRLGSATLLVVSAAIVAVQVAVSVRWMQAFHFGPVERVWRSATYMTWQPLRRPAP